MRRVGLIVLCLVSLNLLEDGPGETRVRELSGSMEMIDEVRSSCGRFSFLPTCDENLVTFKNRFEKHLKSKSNGILKDVKLDKMFRNSVFHSP